MRGRRRRLMAVFGLVGSVALGLTAATPAQRGPASGPDREVTIRVGGPITVPAGDVAGTVVVIEDDVVIDGRVEGTVIVVNGTARIAGAVDGPVVVVNGRSELAASARLGDDLILYRSTVDRDAGATLAGRIVEERGLTFGRSFLLWAWAGSTLVLLVAAGIFVAVGGRLLGRAARRLETRPGRSALCGVGAWVILPILAVAALLTVIGLPLAITVLAVLMPALWLLGYLVTATWLGARLMPLLRARDDRARPYASATLGALAAQVVGLVPLVGGLAVLGAGVLGAGVLVDLAVEHWRHPEPAAEPAA